MTSENMGEAKMISRRFGRTGIRMPVLTAGSMRFMHSWRDMPMEAIPRASQDNVVAVVRHALDLGINHFETARGYGSSERQLGRALRDCARGEIIVQTKIQPTDDPDDFIAHFMDSLARLDVDRVDLLAIHGINTHRSLWQTCRKGGCLHAARGLQKKGLVGHVGFSSHGATEILLAAVRHREDGGFDYMNLHWYYIFQSHWPAIAEAHARDMGVMVISPSDKGGRLYDPPEKLVRLSAPLSPMLFNDLFCLSHPEVNSISIGAAVPTDFTEHLNVLPLLAGNRNHLAAIDGRWRQAMKDAVGHEFPDYFHRILPAWDLAPGAINAPLVLWLYNLARGWDLHTYARQRYRMIGHEDSWVPGRSGESAGLYDFSHYLRGIFQVGDKELVRLLTAAHALLGSDDRIPVKGCPAGQNLHVI